MMKIQNASPQSIGIDYQVNNPKTKTEVPGVSNDQTLQTDGLKSLPEHTPTDVKSNNSLLSQREAVSLYMLFGGEQPAEQKFYGQSKSVAVDIGNFIDVAG